MSVFKTKDPEDKLTKWSGDRQSTEERVQSNDGKDDSRTWEKNGFTEQEVTRSFYNESLLNHLWLFATPWTIVPQAPLSMDFSKNTGLGSHSLLQGILLTQGWNPGLLHCRQILYYWKDWFWSWYKEPTHRKRPWWWERPRAGGEGGNRGWDGWKASRTQWTCKWSHSIVSDSLQSHGLQSARLLCPWDSPGKNTRVGCHFLLQGSFLTQG